MGNKQEIGKHDNNARTPDRMSVSKHQNYLSNKSKSAQKDGLFAEERFFENYDSKL